MAAKNVSKKNTADMNDRTPEEKKKALETAISQLEKSFGKGTVIECKGNVLTVFFNSAGVKKLAKDLAPLKKL